MHGSLLRLLFMHSFSLKNNFPINFPLTQGQASDTLVVKRILLELGHPNPLCCCCCLTVSLSINTEKENARKEGNEKNPDLKRFHHENCFLFHVPHKLRGGKSAPVIHQVVHYSRFFMYFISFPKKVPHAAFPYFYITPLFTRHFSPFYNPPLHLASRYPISFFHLPYLHPPQFFPRDP